MRFFRPYRSTILILISLQSISSVFFLAGPYLSKLFIDQAFLHKDAARFLHLSIIGAALFALSSAAKAVEDGIKNNLEAKIKLSLSRRAIQKLFSLDLAYFQKNSAGENLYKITNLDIVHRFLVEDIPHVAVDVAKVLIILVVAARINFSLTGIFFITSPLLLLWSIFIQRRMLPIYIQLWESNARLSKDLQDAFSKMRIIKALGLERSLRNRTIKALIGSIRNSTIHARWSIINAVSSNFLAKVVYGVVSLYGGWLIIQGRLSVGSFAAAMLYIGQLGGLLESLGYNIQYYSEHRVNLGKFFEIMESIPAIKDSPDAIDFHGIRGEIIFKDVSFGYESNRPVLQGINLCIPWGSWVAIAGPSGCGKTTLVNLLLRLYEPDTGQILLNGVELKRVLLGQLRARIAIAAQEPLLFNLSIKENISLGVQNVASEKIEEAMKLAQLQEVINTFSEGNQHAVGDAGCALSEGIKQRVALARAIIREPDLLILDEATSSIDSMTEEKILHALKEKRRGLATIIISHRLSAIKDAERVYFFGSEGTMVVGAHSQLLLTCPNYRDFFRPQLGS